MYKVINVWLQMKLKMAADRVLKRFSRQIRKEDALIAMVKEQITNTGVIPLMFTAASGLEEVLGIGVKVV
jgi:hypothetical protein